MTLAELMPYVGAGHIILVAEFRGGKVESSGYVDKETGNAIKTLQIVYAVERPGPGMIEKVFLRRYLLPDVTADQVEIKLEKGHLYAFALEKFETKRGSIFARLGPWEPVMIDKGEGAGAPAQAGARPPNLVYNQTTPQSNEQE